MLPDISTGERVSALDHADIEHAISLNSGDIEIVQYDWSLPTSDVWISNFYFLQMSLTPRHQVPQVTYLDVDRRISRSIGRVMLVPPGRKVHTLGGDGRERSLQCSLQPNVINNLLGREPNWDEALLAEGLKLNRPEVDCVLLKIYDELCNPGFAQEFMADLLLNNLAVSLVRTLKLHHEEPVENRGGLATWRMRLIRERIFSEQPTPKLNELADLCKMSVRHLTRAFRTETDMTIASFIEHAMVDRARNLLSSSDHSISEVASLLGFSSSSSFTYAFRRATGWRPAEFRRQSRFSVPLSASH
jgi:AraC family transcriptional regulator